MTWGGRGLFPLAAGLGAVIIGFAALAGWALNVDWPTLLLPGQPRMMPLTAAGMVLAGVGVMCLAVGGRAALAGANLSGAIVALLGLAVLAQYVAHQDLGIDRLLLFDAARERVAELPGRPSPHAALAFLLVGAAIALGSRRPARHVRATDILCFLATGIPYAAIVGYVAGAPEFNRLSPAIGMSVPAAIGFVLVIAGIHGARPDVGVASLVLARTTGGLMLRRLLPLALAVPIVLAYLRALGERLGLYDAQVGIGIMTLGLTALSLIALLLMSGALNRVDLAYRRKSASVERSEALLRAIFDSTPDAIFVKDRHGHFLMQNRSGAALFGRHPEEVIGRPTEEFFPPDLAKAIRFHESSVLQSGTSFSFEETFALPGQGRRTYLTVISPFRFVGHVEGVVGIARDITERKESEAAIHASEAKYRALLEAAPDAVFVVDRTGHIVLANSQAEAMFGYSRQELLGRSIELLVPEASVGVHRQVRSDYMAHPRTRAMGIEMDLQGRRSDGMIIDIEVGLSPVAIDDGGPLVTAIVRDVTERKRIQAEMARHAAEIQAAREAARLKDVFLSSISHEMKTPLSMIVGYAELLEDKDPDDPLVEGILDGTRRLIHHIDSLLTYSALLSGALPLYRTDTCLPEVIRDAASIMEPALQNRGQRLECIVAPDIPSVEADPRRLSQIVQALLENASRFSSPGSTITINVRDRNDHVEVSVRDNGVGMSGADLARIWEPFGQVKVGDAERTGGLGLGLKIARKLVELHGGTISVLSKPGQGTTVTVDLPVGGKLPEAGQALPMGVKQPASQG